MLRRNITQSAGKVSKGCPWQVTVLNPIQVYGNRQIFPVVPDGKRGQTGN
jgi:hypothetical protein